MALTNAIAAYEDCDKLFERALESEKGIRVCLGQNSKAARYLQMRLNHYRTLLREESRRQYDRTDPQYGKSIYDKLYCRLSEDTTGEWWVYIDPAGQEFAMIAIEEIE
mgnify:CR=1 FL=1|jgi:hypothetical protein